MQAQGKVSYLSRSFLAQEAHGSGWEYNNTVHTAVLAGNDPFFFLAKKTQQTMQNSKKKIIVYKPKHEIVLD